MRLSQKYGDIYTFWLFSVPMVIISGIDVAKDVYYKSECSDRFLPNLEISINLLYFGQNKSLFAFSNYSAEWKMLRNISVDAIRYVKLINSI
jgi:hypothetical protein